MVKNYILIAWRVLIRNKYISLINILGLGIAIACCITAYLNLQYATSFDDWHEKKADIYKISAFKQTETGRQNWGILPSPIALTFAEELPAVKELVRMRRVNMTVKLDEEHVFNERIWYFDDPFLDVFTFPLERGTKAAHARQDQIILSHDYAEKYFPEEDPLGKTLILIASNKEKKQYTVGAVAKDYPSNSSINFDILLPYSEYESYFKRKSGDWEHWVNAAFVQMEPGHSVDEVVALANEQVDQLNKTNPDLTMSGFYADNLSIMASNAMYTYSYSLRPGPPNSQTFGALFTASMLLLMSCFNFINTSIAYSARRFKEIGIRKTMGGLRKHLTIQFLGENLLLSVIALLLGLMLAELFVPAYDNLWPNLDLKLNYLENGPLLLMITGLVLLIAVGAGLYPALYVSRYNPVKIFRGRQQIVGTNRLIRILFTFQLGSSVLSIIFSLVFSQNARYQNELDMGFRSEQVLAFQSSDSARLALLQDQLIQLPEVTDWSFSHNIPGHTEYILNLQRDDRAIESRQYFTDERFLNFYEFKLLTGRNFDKTLATDAERSIIVNQDLVKQFGWDEPLGQTLVIEDSITLEVVGVVENFYDAGFWRPIRPTVFRYRPDYSMRHVAVRFDGQPNAFHEKAEALWLSIYPDQPMSGFFADSFTDAAKRTNASIMLMTDYIAIINVVISCLGLFALASLTIAKRHKEMGIRKILGAGALHVSMLLSKQFILLLLLSSVFAGVGGYVLLNRLMGSIFAYHVEVTIWPMVGATLILLFSACLTLAVLLYREIKRNPVEMLRYE